MPPKPRARKGTGTVFRDKSNGKWIGKTSVTVNGKRRARKVTGRTKTEASTRLGQLKIELAEKRATYDVSSETTAQFLTTWVDSLELAPSTTLRYRNLLMRHILSRQISDVRLGDIEAAHVLRLYSDLRGSVSASTVKKSR